VDRSEIETRLRDLAAELEARGVRGELLVVGGAAMALAYSRRRSTDDLDAVFEPKTVIYDAARAVAAQHALDPGWLNDAVKGLLPGPDPNATVFFDHPGLVVRIASARFLLAMKLLASRVERDEDDIATLLRLSNITEPKEALDLVADLYPKSVIPPNVEYLVRELLARDATAG